jgi:hypothetical protein
MAGEQLDRFVQRLRPVTDATATRSPGPPAAPFATE